MFSASFVNDPSPSVPYQDATMRSASPLAFTDAGNTSGVLAGFRRRWRRERRRRKIGRSFDMALEIARLLPRNSRVLDVGCGNGYIAHHLSALLNASVIGLDLDESAEAPIDYRTFNGLYFPVATHSVDAVLLCYVLHHAQELDVVLSELSRTLRPGGRAVVYEDIPENRWDGLMCGIHNRKWRSRTGPCTFLTAQEWRLLFTTAGFELVVERRLSRWRNLAHPVRRRLYVLEACYPSRAAHSSPLDQGWPNRARYSGEEMNARTI